MVIISVIPLALTFDSRVSCHETTKLTSSEGL